MTRDEYEQAIQEVWDDFERAVAPVESALLAAEAAYRRALAPLRRERDERVAAVIAKWQKEGQS